MDSESAQFTYYSIGSQSQSHTFRTYRVHNSSASSRTLIFTDSNVNSQTQISLPSNAFTEYEISPSQERPQPGSFSSQRMSESAPILENSNILAHLQEEVESQASRKMSIEWDQEESELNELHLKTRKASSYLHSKPNSFVVSGVNYRVVLTHYSIMKKPVLLIPFVKGQLNQYLLQNLQLFVSFGIEQFLQTLIEEENPADGDVFEIAPEGKLKYDSIYFCKIPREVNNFKHWQAFGKKMVVNILAKMQEHNHTKIVIPHFRLKGLPQELQVRGMVQAFMNAMKVLSFERIEHPLVEVMLTTNKKIHYQIWKSWLKEESRLACINL